MSYSEAREDGIPLENHNGHTWYYPPCRMCGSPVPSWNYLRDSTYTCQECKKLLQKSRKDITQASKTAKLAKAVRRISKVTDIRQYDTAIALVRKNIDKPLWFQSTEEIMTALELIRSGVKAYHQVKVYDYRADFVLPEYKVVLEIDGPVYHRKETESAAVIRDEIIADKFGEDWEVIHIRTEEINTNVTRLMPAIKAVLARRKKKTV